MGLWSRLERFDDASGWSLDEQNSVLKAGKKLGTLEFSLAGRHNRLNALAALAASCDVGVSPSKALEALSHFSGVKRRLEVKGTKRGVTVIDDLRIIRRRFERRLRHYGPACPERAASLPCSSLAATR